MGKKKAESNPQEVEVPVVPSKTKGKTSSKAKATPEPPAPVLTTPAPPPTTRKRKVAKKEEVVEPPKPEEHIVVQLPIQMDRIHTIMEETNEFMNPLEYCPNILDPEPYAPTNQFISHHDSIPNSNYPGLQEVVDHKTLEEKTKQEEHAMKDLPKLLKNCCYWCCHPIGAKEFGMPIKYDTVHKTFTTFGSFCSLECVTAHNYSHHMGSDRMWEVHSWIQWMAQKMGYETPIRPAPNRFLLKMFNGPLEIDEFRELHKSYLKTFVMNMPPLIHVQGQMETINTSYLNQKTGGGDGHRLGSGVSGVMVGHHITEVPEKVKLSRKKAVMDMKKTLDAKMNLTIKSVGDVEST